MQFELGLNGINYINMKSTTQFGKMPDFLNWNGYNHNFLVQNFSKRVQNSVLLVEKFSETEKPL